MTNTKLIKLLKTLEKEEFLRLSKFLRSPFFNYTQSLVAFYEQLKKAYPVFAEKKLQPEKLWAKVFPDKPFSQGKFLRLCSDLSLQVEKYLVQVELEQPTPAAQHLLIKSLGRRNNYALYEKEVRDRLKNTTENKIRDASWYKERMDLLEDWYFHPKKNKFDKNDNTLNYLSEHLDSYFLLQKARYSISIRSMEKILKTHTDIKFLNLLNEEEEDFNNISLLLYKLSLKLLLNQEEVTFRRLETILFENLEDINIEDKKLFFSNGLNYAVGRLNRGFAGYQITVFDWYKFGLENTLIQSKNFISEVAFQNIVYAGCKVEKFDWVKQFINEYGIYLKESLRDDCLFYCEALLCFYEKDLDRTISILLRENWVNTYFLPSRNLLIRAQFEYFLSDIKYFEVLQNSLQSFEFFIIRTKKFPKKRLEVHLNLVRVLKKTTHKVLKNNGKVNNECISFLKREISSERRIISKQWLTILFNLKG